MSTWIYVTKLPMYSDYPMLLELFQCIGPITDMRINKDELIFKSDGFIQFSSPKHAKTACSKKDKTIVEKSQIRVFLRWTPDENLSTIRVRNFPLNYTSDDLKYLFNTHGDIVDIRIMDRCNDDDHKSEYQPHALISFVSISHATSAAQEMNGSVIGCEGALSVELVNSDARNLQWKRHSFEYINIPIPPPDESFPMQNHHRRHRNRRHRHSDHKNNGHLHPPQHDRHHHHQYSRHGRNHDSGHQRRRHRRDDGHKTRRSVRDTASQSTLLGPLYIGSNGQYHTYSVTPSPTRPHGNVSDSSSNDSHHLHVHHAHTSLQRNTSTDSIASNHSVQSLPSTFVPPGPSSMAMHDKKRTAMDHYGMPSKYGNQTHHSPQPFYPQQNAVQRTPVSPSTSIISTGSTTHSVPTPTGFVAANPLTRSLTPTGLCISSLTPTSTTPVSTPPMTTANAHHFPTNAMNPMFAPNATGTLPPITGHLSHEMNQITSGLSQATLDTINRVNAARGVQAMPMLSQLSPTALTPPIHLTPTTNQMIMQQISAVDGVPQNVQCTGNNAQHTPILYSPPTLQGPLKMTPVQPQNFRFPNQGKTEKSGKVPTSKKRKKSKPWTKDQQLIGNELHTLIKSKYPERATKIVGMLLSAFSCENLRFMMQQDTCILQVAFGYDQQIQEKEARRNAK